LQRRQPSGQHSGAQQRIHQHQDYSRAGQRRVVQARRSFPAPPVAVEVRAHSVHATQNQHVTKTSGSMGRESSTSARNTNIYQPRDASGGESTLSTHDHVNALVHHGRCPLGQRRLPSERPTVCTSLAPRSTCPGQTPPATALVSAAGPWSGRPLEIIRARHPKAELLCRVSA
jgi:hypothetical protein